jgi:hypothetical protein
MDPELEGLLHINPPTDLRTRLEIRRLLDGPPVEIKENLKVCPIVQLEKQSRLLG